MMQGFSGFSGLRGLGEPSGGSPPTAFSPDDITGLNLWNRGDTGLKTGGARQYTAANSEYHSRADNAFFSTGDIDFYIATWVYLDSLPGPGDESMIVTKDSASGRDYVLEYNGDGNAFRAFFINVSVKVVLGTSFGAASTATWYFVEMWHDATFDTLNIKINDGTVDTTATAGVAPVDSGTEFMLGARAFSGFEDYHNGRISRTYFAKNASARAIIDDSTLSTWLYNNGNGRLSGEVAAHATLGAFLDGVVSDYFNLNESSGNAISYSGLNDLTDNATVTAADGPATEVAEDSSANLNHGVSNAGPVAWKSETPDGSPDPTCQDTSGNNYHLTIVDGTAASYSDTAGSEYPRDASVPSGIGSTASLEFDGTLYGSVVTSPFFLQSATEAAIEFYCDIESADFNGTVVVPIGTGSGIYMLFDDREAPNPTDGILVFFKTVTGSARSVNYDNVIGGLSAGFHKYRASYDSVNFVRLWIDDVLQTITGTNTAGTGDFIPVNAAMGIGAQNNGTSILPAGVHLDRVRLYDDAAATNLIAEYLFEESNLRDLPLITGSLKLNGSDDYVDVGAGPSGVKGLSFWINPDDISTRKLIDCDGTDQIELDASGNVTATSFPDATVYVNGVQTAGPVVVSVWSHIMVTDGTGVACTNFDIGRAGASNEFDGLITDVRLYDTTEPTATRVYNLYTGTDDQTNLEGHWKLDDGAQSPVVDQDPVIEWKSKEGNNYQFQQATAAKRPLARLGADGMNGKTAVQFNNVNQILILDSAPITDVVGTITVSFETDANPTGSGDMTLIGSAKASVANEYLEALSIDNAGKLYTEFNDAGTVHRVTGGTVLAANTKYVVTVTATAAGAWVITLDGVDETLAVTVANSGKWFGDLDAPTNMFVGGRAISTGEDNHFGGLFAEDVLYDTDLTDAQQDSVEGYSGTRYGVTIA